jgi:DNA-binding SARP family transcriptional activator/pimeloyl-ACP methyl ester carboxylesterase
MPTFCLYLFGAPRLEQNGKAVPIQRRKTTALLAYLAATGKLHTREALATLFWPEHDQAGALANLRRDLSRLKSILGEGVLQTERLLVGVSRAEAIWVDTLAFQQLVKVKHTHGEAEVCQDCMNRLEEGVGLYRAGFMSGFNLPDSPGFDEWQFFTGGELQQALLIALQKLIDWHVGLDELDQSIHYARQWLAHDYFHEPAHRRLMQLYAWSGQRAAALHQFQECARLLQQELGVEPEDETIQLYEAIRRRQLSRPAWASLEPDESVMVPEPELEHQLEHFDLLMEAAAKAQVGAEGSGEKAPAPPAGSFPVAQKSPIANHALKQQLHYCRSGDGVTLAYATVGQGPPLVKAANWLSHLEFDWKSPVWRHWLVGLAQNHTLVRYDERGCGLSDWEVANMSFEAWVSDLEAVVEAAGLERFPLLGISQGGAIAIAYAIRHPEKVSQLILYGSYARGRLRRAPTPEQIDEIQIFNQLIRLGWGKEHPAFRQVFSTLFLPEGTVEQIQAFNELQRITSTPENAARIVQEFNTIDVRPLAAQIQIPTLVMHARGDLRIPIEEGQLLASLIPGARFLTLESNNHILLESEPAWQRFLFEVESFLAIQE